jgi:hypothetical protein
MSPAGPFWDTVGNKAAELDPDNYSIEPEKI